MGFRFRKSFGFGPFRATISKSGISTSVGVKGARITKRADGKTQTTLSIPGTGISHVTTSSGKKTAAPAASAAPTRSVACDSVKAPSRPTYEHRTFYLLDTVLANPDGTKRQDILYRYKMRKPPFEDVATLSISSNAEKPEFAEVCANGEVVGVIPEKHSRYINKNWERMDRISAMEVEGRRGEYDACVYVRFFAPEEPPAPEPVSEPEKVPPVEVHEPKAQRPGCLKGCLIAIGVFFLLFVVCLFSACSADTSEPAPEDPPAAEETVTAPPAASRNDVSEEPPEPAEKVPPVSEPDAQPEPKPVASDPVPEPEPVIQSPESEPEPVPEPEPAPKPEPEPEPVPVVVPTPAPEPEPKAEPKPAPEPEPTPEPESVPVVVPTPAPEPEPEPEPVVSEPVTAGVIGNKNSKKFHEPSCSSVGDIKEKNKIALESADVALSMGYEPCQRCH